jgi:hypothetical protein
MSNHTTRTTLPPPHLRWWHCDHEGPGLEGCPVCRPGHDREAGLWAAGLLRALERESLALVGSLAAERDRERRRAEAAEAALATARAEGAAAERARILDVIRERAADRAAQAAVCAVAGGNADVVYAKESECGALAAIIDGTATMPRWPGRPVESA